MKKNLKFIVAVFGITVATFGSIDKGNATKELKSVDSPCSSSVNNCGWHGDDPIPGTFVGCP